MTSCATRIAFAGAARGLALRRWFRRSVCVPGGAMWEEARGGARTRALVARGGQQRRRDEQQHARHEAERNRELDLRGGALRGLAQAHAAGGAGVAGLGG